MNVIICCGGGRREGGLPGWESKKMMRGITKCKCTFSLGDEDFHRHVKIYCPKYFIGDCDNEKRAKLFRGFIENYLNQNRELKWSNAWQKKNLAVAQ